MASRFAVGWVGTACLAAAIAPCVMALSLRPAPPWAFLVSVPFLLGAGAALVAVAHRGEFRLLKRPHDGDAGSASARSRPQD